MGLVSISFDPRVVAFSGVLVARMSCRSTQSALFCVDGKNRDRDGQMYDADLVYM